MPSSQTAAEKAIRLHLAARNKRQVWLAEQLGVTSFWLTRRMTGVMEFSVTDLDRIAAVFGTTLENLLADAEAVASCVRVNGWVCPGWERDPHESRDLTAAHSTAVAVGGVGSLLSVLCRSCNSRQGDAPSRARQGL